MMQNDRLSIDDITLGIEDFHGKILQLTNAPEVYEQIWVHVRHVIDHIEAIIVWQNIYHQTDKYIIDYVNHRNRWSKLETDRQIFGLKIRDILTFFEDNISWKDLQIPVIKREMIDWKTIDMTSTLENELYYSIFQHATHHIALMVKILKEKWYHIPDNNIWKSASTIHSMLK